MGCDIHGTIEITHHRNDNDYIEYIMELPYRRSYVWFATLADVRNTFNIPVLSEPKGLPYNASITTIELHKEREEDYHSESYLTVKELNEINWSQIIPYTDKPMSLVEAVGSVWYGLVLMLNWMAREYGEDSVRIVFWFDN